MQRLLREHGTSFREFLDEVRVQHARGYLTGTASSDAEITLLLGFGDPTSFHRAFRGWTGVSPAQYRRRERAGSAYP